MATPIRKIAVELERKYRYNRQQRKSWAKSIEFLRHVNWNEDQKKSIYVIIEYELPRQGGRRPDIVLVTEKTVFIIEVKDKNKKNSSDFEQTRGYLRDIQYYHKKTREMKMEVTGILLLLSGNQHYKEKNIHILSKPSHLEKLINENQISELSKSDVQNWINSDFEPLPTIIEAAKLIFENKPLPQIKQAKSAGIPETLIKIHEIVQEAEEENDYRLILVSGIPGSGKTLVGLQFVHEFSSVNNTEERGVYLSGNGPLVEVLQYALESQAFVQDVHKFIREYGIKRKNPPLEHVLIFDEAQRAWDQEKMSEWYQKKQKLTVEASEPELFIDVIAESKEWGVVIGLIGYGQEIHTGEESGISQWNEAVLYSNKDWKVYGANRFQSHFNGSEYISQQVLDLNQTLRSHLAEQLDIWVEAVIEGDKQQASHLTQDIQARGFYLYITDDLDRGKSFLRNRYEEEPNKTFGMIASSKSKNLKDHGLDTGYYSRDIVRMGRNGPWYYKKDKPELHCTELKQAVTEFGCQGLELDGILVGWGRDYYWSENDQEWKSLRFTRRNKAKDPYQLRKNSYRVLLTRARDGMVIFCPKDKWMRDTYQFLLDIGVTELDEMSVDNANKIQKNGNGNGH